EPPILFKYGFILINGKKYSKSKGIGMSATELMELVPPELVKYVLTEPDVQRDKDIDPTGDKLILLYNEIERINALKAPENRADEKKVLAFKVSIKSLSWKASFVDVLLNYQIFKDWKKVGALLNDPQGVAYLAPYIERWLAKGFAPERYNFSIKNGKITESKELVKDFISHLKPGMTDLEVHNLIYQTAKANNISADPLFAALYTALIGKEKGPRAGKLIASIGIAKVKEMLEYSIS
ncbi:MAG: class I tRNA ligase family protein, partial [Candidatus Micrarchaeota archaeon]|nr:class I tRNA ligase family protein [Candidatus Micrarchaeota archaeon]